MTTMQYCPLTLHASVASSDCQLPERRISLGGIVWEEYERSTWEKKGGLSLQRTQV